MTGKTGLMAMAVCVAAWTTAGDVFAQAKESDPLKFTVSAYGEQTDNRDSLREKQPGDTDDREYAESNFDFYIKPLISYDAKGQRTDLSFHYAPYYRRRSNASDIQNETEIFHDFTLDLKYRPSNPVKLRASDAFYYTDDPSIDKNGITTRRDSSYMMNIFEIGGAFPTGPRSSMDISGRDTLKRYDDEAVAGESDEDNMGVTLMLSFMPQNTLGIMAMLDVASFDYLSETNHIERGFSAISAGAGLQKNVSKDLSFSLRGGMIAVSYDSGEIDDGAEPFAAMALDSKLMLASRMNMTLVYQLKDSDVYPFPSQECTEFKMRMEWDTPSKLMTLGLYGTYRLGKFYMEDLTQTGKNYQLNMSEFDLEGDKTTTIVQADVKWKIGDTTDIKLAFSSENVTSDVSEEFTRNAVSMLATQAF